MQINQLVLQKVSHLTLLSPAALISAAAQKASSARQPDKYFRLSLFLFFFTSEGKKTSSVDTSESLESCRFGQNAQLYKICVRRGLVSVPAWGGDDTNHRDEKVCSSVTGSFRGRRAKASLACCLWASVLRILWSSQDFPNRVCC